jgi:hypothetical protein
VRGGELDGGRARWWGGRYDVAVREWEEGGEGWEFDGGGVQLCGGRYGVMVKALSSGDRVGGHGCQVRGGPSPVVEGAQGVVVGVGEAR